MPLDRAALQKVYAAEHHVAKVRLAVILFNIGVYYFVMGPEGTIPWLAATIAVVSTTYAVGVIVARPYRHFPLLLSSYFTTFTDASLITLWIIATGQDASPFYALWAVSLVAIAFRYDPATTMLAAGVYVVCDMLIMVGSGAAFTDPVQTAIRPAYILFIGVLGGMLSREAYGQATERLKMETVAAALENEVRRRTADLEESRSRLKDSYEDLREANERLTELDKLKTQLLNTASHELNTPLTPIKLQVHLLRAGSLGDLSERQRRSVEVVGRNVDRLAVLVGDMLDVARLQSGRLVVRRRPIDLNEVVRETYDVFADPAEQQHIRLALDLDDRLPARADAHRITQVLYNLLSNAIKFTPEGGTIRVEGRTDGKEVTLRVIDSGAGLTRVQQERLFRPFSQVHDLETSDKGGTGLGLYICRGIIEQHKGRIWAQSDGPGTGSVFAFSLPHDDTPPAEVPEGEEEVEVDASQDVEEDAIETRLRYLA